MAEPEPAAGDAADDDVDKADPGSGGSVPEPATADDPASEDAQAEADRPQEERGLSADDAREEISEALRSLAVEGTRPVQRLRAWWLLFLGVALGIALVVTVDVRLGGYVMAGALAGAALLRLVLPTWVTGGLVTRGRFADTLMMLALAVGTAVLVSALNLPA